jgi:hypothetical protein
MRANSKETEMPELPHYYVEEPSFVGGHLIRAGSKIKTDALPSVKWRPLNQPAYDNLRLVLEETFEYEIHLQDGTVKTMTHQPRLMSRTLGGGRGSLGTHHAEAVLSEHEDSEPHLEEGQTLAEVVLRKGGRSQDQRPGPARAKGPDAFEPTPPGELEEGPTGAPGEAGVLVTQGPPLGAGYGSSGAVKTTSKGSPIAPTKNGVVE